MGGLKTLRAAPLLKSVSSPPNECLEGCWQCFERSVGPDSSHRLRSAFSLGSSHFERGWRRERPVEGRQMPFLNWPGATPSFARNMRVICA